MIVSNILWDVDNPEDLDYLPTTLKIPDGMNEEEIEDYLSNLTGFCHAGYTIES